MSHNYSVLIIVLLVIFGIYRRVRRSIGAQVLRPRTLRTRAYIFIAIMILLLVASYAEPLAYISDAVGIIIGGFLAYFAIKTTQFERGSRGWVYRTHAWISGVVIALFFARLVDRFYESYHVMNQASMNTSGAAASAQMHNSIVGDPWTAGMFFILFAYYSCYNLYLVGKAKQLDAESGGNDWGGEMGNR